MRFPYHQIDEDSIEPAGSIQSRLSETNDNISEDDTLSPSKPILPYWPFWAGLVQIVVGFLCTAFGAVQVFIVPALISVDANFGLYRYNFYGAAIWSGLLLAVSGCSAVRASKKRDLFTVIQFYVIEGLSFLICFALQILTLWCYIEITDSSKCNEIFPFLKQDCDFQKIHKYSVISLLSAVWCLLGCLLLFLSTVNYFWPVMLGEVHLLKKLGVCWFPCFFYFPPKEALETYKQEQNVIAQN